MNALGFGIAAVVILVLLYSLIFGFKLWVLFFFAVCALIGVGSVEVIRKWFKRK